MPAFLTHPIISYCLPNTTLTSKTFQEKYKFFILILTFFSYLSYHASRKPITIVKAELHMNCSSLDPNNTHPHNSSTWCDWAPFDGDDYKTLFSQLDYGFLLAYAVGMFISGMTAERTSLRYFLFFGMQLSGIFTILFGLGHDFKIHKFSYFLLIQIINGFIQSTGWPAVVSLVGNWFGKSKRGLIMGVWNSHTSFGNIFGSLIAASFVESDWALSFVIPGVVIMVFGVIVLLTVFTSPRDMNLAGGLEGDNILAESDTNALLHNNLDENVEEIESEHDEDDQERTTITATTHEAISFFQALKIPGVLEFSFSLFFAKLVSYTFLFWLPFYLSSAFKMDARLSGDYSTIFDIGGIIGGIIAGAYSDYSGKRAVTCGFMLSVGSLFLLIFQSVASINNNLMIISLFLTGLVVNGPYALITTAVSADLGTHECLQGNSGALATVTSIIDGVGSVGAATGPFLVGVVAGKSNNWTNVFAMLLVCNVSAVGCLVRLIKKEW